MWHIKRNGEVYTQNFVEKKKAGYELSKLVDALLGDGFDIKERGGHAITLEKDGEIVKFAIRREGE